MSKYQQHCKTCGKFFYIEEDNVIKERIPRGYKYEEEKYHVKCPGCRGLREVRLRELPLKIAWKKFWE